MTMIELLPLRLREWVARHSPKLAFVMVGLFAGAEMYMQLGGTLPFHDSKILRAGVFAVITIGGVYWRWRAGRGK